MSSTYTKPMFYAKHDHHQIVALGNFAMINSRLVNKKNKEQFFKQNRIIKPCRDIVNGFFDANAKNAIENQSPTPSDGKISIFSSFAMALLDLNKKGVLTLNQDEVESLLNIMIENSSIGQSLYDNLLQIDAFNALENLAKNSGNAELAFWFCYEQGSDDDVRQVIIDAGDPEFAFLYCRYISDDADMRQVILDSGDADWAVNYLIYIKQDTQNLKHNKVIKEYSDFYDIIKNKATAYQAYQYCTAFGSNPELRHKIITKKEPDVAYLYCANISDDADMRQIIIDTDDNHQRAKYALDYCAEIKPNKKMRQAILDSGEAKQLYEYCVFVKDDEDMRQALIKTKDPQWAYRYCCDKGDGSEMRQVIIDSGNTTFAYKYCRDVLNHADVRQVIIDSGDPRAAAFYCHLVSNDADMRQVIVEGADLEALRLYLINFDQTIKAEDIPQLSQIRQVILESGNAEYAFCYITHIDSNDTEMVKVIANSGELDFVLAYADFCKVDSLRVFHKMLIANKHDDAVKEIEYQFPDKLSAAMA